ncbi:hypothetical protein JL720_17170 [Aureococcus anophagefferens]|nr:hypothetical protein JL720_17170 [Aureococcus anophagefferens]
MRAPKGQRWDVTAKIKARDEKLGALRSLLSRVAEQRKAFGTLVSQIEVKLLATAAEERDKADKADKALVAGSGLGDRLERIESERDQARRPRSSSSATRRGAARADEADQRRFSELEVARHDEQDKVSAAVAACDANVASARRSGGAPRTRASVASHADALQALRSELAASEAERDRLGEASARADGGAAETRARRVAEAAARPPGQLDTRRDGRGAHGGAAPARARAEEERERLAAEVLAKSAAVASSARARPRRRRVAEARGGRGRGAGRRRGGARRPARDADLAEQARAVEASLRATAEARRSARRERTAALAQLLALQGRCDLDRAAFEAEAAALGDDRAANDAALAARARTATPRRRGSRRETELASLRAELDEKNEIDAKAQALALSEARGEELRGNIRVFARVRPFLPSDGAAADAPPVVVDMADGTSLTLAAEDDDADGEPFGDKKRKRRKELFSYDHVFARQRARSVFTEVAEFVQSALDGYQRWSRSPRTATRSGWAYEMEVSYVEIYNEQVRDLLADNGPAPAPGGDVRPPKPAGLEVRRDPKTGRVYVDGCTRTPVDPGDKAMVDDLMQCAATHRCVAATDMNAVSSRSHAVFTLHLTGTHAEKKARLKGALNLVDLAGSERLDRSGAVGQRAKEAAHINKSLSPLARRAAPRWEKLWTRDGSACFYHDVDAGTVTWDEPDGYDPARDGGGRGDDVVVGDRCAWELLRTDDGHPFYHNVDTGEVTWDAPDDFDDASDHDDASVTWTRHRDSATGRDYYHNLDTGETTWERPEVEEEEEDEEEEEEEDDDDEGWAMRAARHHYEGGVAHDEPTLHPADELAAAEPIACEPAERAEGRGSSRGVALRRRDAPPRRRRRGRRAAPVVGVEALRRLAVAEEEEEREERRSSASKLFGVSEVADEEEEPQERRSSASKLFGASAEEDEPQERRSSASKLFGASAEEDEPQERRSSASKLFGASADDTDEDEAADSQGGLETLLRAIVVMPQLPAHRGTKGRGLPVVMAEALVLKCVAALLRDEDAILGLVSESTEDLEALFADVLVARKSWVRVGIVVRTLIALCVGDRPADGGGGDDAEDFGTPPPPRRLATPRSRRRRRRRRRRDLVTHLGGDEASPSDAGSARSVRFGAVTYSDPPPLEAPARRRRGRGRGPRWRDRASSARLDADEDSDDDDDPDESEALRLLRAVDGLEADERADAALDGGDRGTALAAVADAVEAARVEAATDGPIAAALVDAVAASVLRAAAGARPRQRSRRPRTGAASRP